MAIVLTGAMMEFPARWIDPIRAFVQTSEPIWVDPHVPDLGAVRVAVAWNPVPGRLRQFPNLEAVLCPGAGVDGILGDRDLPDVPIARTIDPGLILQMSQYILWATLDWVRQGDIYRHQQRSHHWQMLPLVDPRAVVVGILGLGVLGQDAATRLRAAGFTVRGWSRTPKSLAGVKCFAGADGLPELLRGCQVLVCLLPLTPETTGILNADTFAMLPQGAYVINVGRGAHLVEVDLQRAIAQGQIGGACLDVCATEPLPPDAPLWDCPNVTITPHAAALTSPAAIATHLDQLLSCLETNTPIPHLINRDRGY